MNRYQLGREGRVITSTQKRASKREELIKAAIAEINQYGVTGFSMRRVAETCGVSCAAPAKHFGDRRGFMAAIIEYVDAQWYATQLKIIEQYPDNLRKRIVEISVAYVKFLVENSYFRFILMLDNNQLRVGLSTLAEELVRLYCNKVQMDNANRERKQYVIRALIFGAAMMFENGEMEYCDRTIENVRYNIDREFDLP